MSTPGTPDVSQPTLTTPTDATSGRVKWFNNKAGYGFITVSVGDNAGTDVFVHHSAVEVSQEQSRYLVQGEYVEFTLCQVEDDVHKWQAGTVKGPYGGKLMCETRLETREQRMTHNKDDESYSHQPHQESSSRDNHSRDNHSRDNHSRDNHSRDNHSRDNQSRDNQSRDNQQYRIRSRGSGPREGDEWMLVRRRNPRQGGSQRQLSSPQQEVLRSRHPKTSP